MLMRLRFLFLLILLISLGAQGQEKRVYMPSDDQLSIDSLARIEQGIPTALMIDPSLIQKRLKSIESRIPLVYNVQSHQYVEYFAFRKAAFTQHNPTLHFFPKSLIPRLFVQIH